MTNNDKVLVPREPTIEMVTAWIQSQRDPNRTIEASYRAMLAAAPQPAEPAYDRELITRMLEELFVLPGHNFRASIIAEQAALLRAADNAIGSGVTVRKPAEDGLPEDATSYEVVTEFIRIGREMRPVGQWPGERVYSSIESVMSTPRNFICPICHSPERQHNGRGGDAKQPLPPYRKSKTDDAIAYAQQRSAAVVVDEAMVRRARNAFSVDRVSNGEVIDAIAGRNYGDRLIAGIITAALNREEG